MIRSMTAYSSAQAHNPHVAITVELRSINSRFLDLILRVPDELRQAEPALRALLTRNVQRGKVEARVQFTREDPAGALPLDIEHLTMLAERLAQARAIVPDLEAPRLMDVLGRPRAEHTPGNGSDDWAATCLNAAEQAIAALQAGRAREGERLADMMRQCAQQIDAIVAELENALPALLAEQQKRITDRLHHTLADVSPDGYARISGEELSARIAQEASLFSLRADVAEELSRLRSHTAELHSILSGGAPATGTRGGGSVGKRLDFLCQELGREANTLGSKSASLAVTRAAIDLKLLIEQIREQAQNIE